MGFFLAKRGSDIRINTLFHIHFLYYFNGNSRTSRHEPFLTRDMAPNYMNTDLAPNCEIRNNPCVSVVLPCYNSENYVDEALSSCLAQTYQNIEIIAVDDGSTDSTLACLLSFKSKNPQIRLIVLTHEDRSNHGVAASRLLAFMHARGEYISLLDSDDTYHPFKLQSQVECLQRHPSVVVCHTAVNVMSALPDDIIDSHETHFSCSPIVPYRFARLSDYLCRLHISNSSACIRASALRQIRYPPRMSNSHEDWLLWVLLARKGLFVQLPERLVNYQMRPQSLSAQVNSSCLTKRHRRIEFLYRVFLATLPSFTSMLALFFLVRSLAGLGQYNIFRKSISLRFLGAR
jgi:glycosyltransferase involved in cell wall biosynthesis